MTGLGKASGYIYIDDGETVDSLSTYLHLTATYRGLKWSLQGGECPPLENFNSVISKIRVMGVVKPPPPDARRGGRPGVTPELLDTVTIDVNVDFCETPEYTVDFPHML